MFNLNEKIYEWVEKKVGEQVDVEIEKSILNRNAINVTSFVQKLVDENFDEGELQKLRAKVQSERDFESNYSVDEFPDNILSSSLDLSALSLKEKSASGAEQAVKQILQTFDYLSPDEVISQPSWPSVRKAIHDLILQSGEKKAAIFGIKVMRRLITYASSSKAVCEGFVTLAENVVLQVEGINSRANRVEAEELYDITGGKVVRKSSHRRRLDPPAENDAVEMLTRSMYLLLQVQNGMPGTWLRFGEKRLLEIVSSFLHMLSVSFPMERRNVSGFDLVSTLDPRATWCRHWCHGSLGRGLLCQELRKNRRFFHAIVDTVITGVPSMKQINSAPSSASNKDRDKGDDQTTILGLSTQTVKNARFSHCFSMVTYIIQWRVGRALFPIQAASRRRPWTAQDVVGLMVDYVLHVDRHHASHKPSYVHHMIGLGKALLTIEEEISSARGLQKRSFR